VTNLNVNSDDGIVVHEYKELLVFLFADIEISQNGPMTW
jgi:hypothetical protein